MKLTDFLLILLHIGLAYFIYAMPSLAKVYGTGLILFVFLQALVTRQPKYLIYTAAYVVGAEVFTRMTKGLFFYESHKYLIMILALAYIVRNGLKKEALLFAGYLLLLVPGTIYTMILEANNPSFEVSNIRITILFNLSGPLVLGTASMAWVKEKLTLDDFKRVNFWMLLPIISTTFYLIWKTPSLQDIVFKSSANFATSGGFGPNQVATILGLGMFASFVLFLTTDNILKKTIYLFLFGLITYRAFLTFSRGGTITGIIMIVLFLLASWRSDFRFLRTKSIIGILLSAIIIAVSFYFVVEVTQGMALNRFTGKNTAGQKKEDVTSGRLDIFKTELETFFTHPFLGVGVGRAKIERIKRMGFAGATHNEISRLLSEHGIFGLFALILLLVAPFVTGAFQKNNIFFYPYYAFWFLTIFHSSMRLAAPGTLYAFSLIILQMQQSFSRPSASNANDQ